MKKVLLAGVAAAGLLAASSAFAADLPSRRVAPVAPAPVVPIFTWTGFYVGVNAGYGWNTNNHNGYLDPATGIVYDSGNGNDGGFVGGGQLGYNYQFGQFVLGAEADIQYADLNNHDRNDYYASLGYIPLGTNSLDWFGTVRARLGFAIDRILIYGTGGFAYGGGNGDSYVYNGVLYKNDDTRTGWTVGGGVEYAFTDNITARVEGLYVNLGHDNNGIFGNNHDTEFGVVRAGLNYKFSSF